MPPQPPVHDSSPAASGPARAPFHRARWPRPPRALVVLLFAFLAAVAAARWTIEIHHALFDPTRHGANDLRRRYAETQAWFNGEDVYARTTDAVYPPASYVMFWPALGWSSFQVARRLWTLSGLALFVWLFRSLQREMGVRAPPERWLYGLCMLAVAPLVVNFGTGQVGIHILAALLGSLFLLTRRPPGWGRDSLAAALFLFTLIKPSVSAPFFWLVMFVSGSMRPALLVVAGYVSLTFLAAIFQPAGLLDLFRACVGNASEWYGNGYADLHEWLRLLGLSEWAIPASLTVLGLLGLWTYLHRDRDLWLLLGIAGIVSRLWTYHLWHDEVVLVLAAVALFRVARQSPAPDPNSVGAAVLLALLVAGMIVPTRGAELPVPWSLPWRIGLPLIWASTLVLLMVRARAPESRASGFARPSTAGSRREPPLA
ncbi:MAG: glycosyltransferase family 87 protein [Gemmatimonadota bacterium]